MSYETFNPGAHGWSIQRGYSLAPIWPVLESESELGYVSSVAYAERVRRKGKFRWIATSRAAASYVRSFLSAHLGPAGRFWFELPEFLPDPHSAPVLEAVVGGSQPARVIRAAYSWSSASGETLPSPEAELSLPEANLLRLSVPIFPLSATTATIYAREIGGDATVQRQAAIGPGARWTQPNAPMLLDTADPATVSTAREVILAKLVAGENDDPIRGAGTIYELELTLEEVHGDA